MTTEEAIEILSDVGDINRCCAEDAEALDMAIKALEIQACKPDGDDWESYADRLYELAYQHGQTDKEPCEDCISRKDVIDIINFEDKWLLDAKGHNANTEIAFSGFKSKVKALPSVAPKAESKNVLDIIKAEQQPCEDAISREAVDEYITNLLSGYLYDQERKRLEDLTAYIWELPSVQPTRPTGHWIVYEVIDFGDFVGTEKYECSECHHRVGVFTSNFCPNCGARMGGEA